MFSSGPLSELLFKSPINASPYILQANWEDIIYSPWVDVAPYLSWSAESQDIQGLKLYSWYLVNSLEHGNFAGNIWDYGKIVRNFLEDPN
jgi:hypothetical protein